MAKSSKKEQQDKVEAEKILTEVNFTDDEMVIAQKLAEEFMRHENPEEYEVAKKEKDNNVNKVSREKGMDKEKKKENNNYDK